MNTLIILAILTVLIVGTVKVVNFLYKDPDPLILKAIEDADKEPLIPKYGYENSRNDNK